MTDNTKQSKDEAQEEDQELSVLLDSKYYKLSYFV